VRAKRTADKSAKATEWLVYRLGGPKATFLGHVTAPNREMALAVAYDEFNVTTPSPIPRARTRRMAPCAQKGLRPR